LKKGFSKVIKRIFDFVSALIIGIVALPVLGITMAIIHFNSPEDPVIFRQIRTGYKGKEFCMFKLRTMTNEKDENGELLPDEFRFKKWGVIIRKLSIDELTQIIHILKGEMSWIGPRPLLPKEMLVMTAEEQAERQAVLPGVTGWEAVNEDLSDSRRRMAEFDLEYVRNWSIGFDIKIIIKTITMMFSSGRAEDSKRAPKLREEEIISGKEE